MNLKEAIEQAIESWNILVRESISPEDKEAILDLVHLAHEMEVESEPIERVTVQDTEINFQDNQRPIQEAMREVEKIQEEIEEITAAQSLRWIKDKVAQLEGIVAEIDGQVCPLTLMGEWPRACIQEKCMWNGKSANDCVGHVFVRGGNIATEMKAGSTT